ncbi:MAG: AAA family ATPase [Pseudomonadales bacterium]|nr:AAA family ATPase [Pseudomonadales bacterium]
MKKIVIFGNSGSGKSTLAKQLSETGSLAHLDLDLIAWLSESPPKRKTIWEAKQEIEHFINKHDQWVIEGCYADLLELTLPYSSEIIFMDLPIQLCIDNARNRPWEPHKYESKAAQDANLQMLIDWISQYEKRKDTFSRASHHKLFVNFAGKKKRYTNNQR